MSVIKIHVNNEVATIVDGTTTDVTSGDIGTIDIEFSFSSEWNEFKKTILLYKGLYDPKDATWILIDEDKLLGKDIPPMLFETPGFLSIGIFGDDDSGNRLTTNIVTKRIDIGTPALDTEDEIDYSLYNQIIGKLILLERTTKEFDEKYSNGITEIVKILAEAMNEIGSKKDECIGEIQSRHDTAINDFTKFKDEKIDELIVQVNGHITNINNVANGNINNINNITNTNMQNINQAVVVHQETINNMVNEGNKNILQSVDAHLKSITASVEGHMNNIGNAVNAGIVNINQTKDAAIDDFKNDASNYYTKEEVDALIESVMERG